MAKATKTIVTKQWRVTDPQAFQRHTTAVIVVSVSVLVTIGWLDYITGYEFGFFIFYFIPVAIAAWYGGRVPGVANAVMSAFCWYISDHYTHHPYSKAYFIYWETFMRLLSFLTTALTVARIRNLVLNEERMLAELLEARARLHELQGKEDQLVKIKNEEIVENDSLSAM